MGSMQIAVATITLVVVTLLSAGVLEHRGNAKVPRE